MSTLINPLPTLSECSIEILHRVADGKYVNVRVTPHLENLIKIGAVTIGHRYSTSWNPGQYAVARLTNEGRDLELAFAKSEIKTEKDRNEYYWRERGIRRSISQTLVAQNINNEDDLQEYGYDRMMRLGITLEDKSKIAEVAEWGILSQDDIIKAWLKEGFSRRVANIFAYEGIIDEEGLCNYEESELLRIPNFGKTSLREVRQWLGKTVGTEFSIRRQEHPTLKDCTTQELLDEIKRRITR
jgi:hypothetical protein